MDRKEQMAAAAAPPPPPGGGGQWPGGPPAWAVPNWAKIRHRYQSKYTQLRRSTRRDDPRINTDRSNSAVLSEIIDTHTVEFRGARFKQPGDDEPVYRVAAGIMVSPNGSFQLTWRYVDPETHQLLCSYNHANLSDAENAVRRQRLERTLFYGRYMDNVVFQQLREESEAEGMYPIEAIFYGDQETRYPDLFLDDPAVVPNAAAPLPASRRRRRPGEPLRGGRHRKVLVSDTDDTADAAADADDDDDVAEGLAFVNQPYRRTVPDAVVPRSEHTQAVAQMRRYHRLQFMRNHREEQRRQLQLRDMGRPDPAAAVPDTDDPNDLEARFNEWWELRFNPDGSLRPPFDEDDSLGGGGTAKPTAATMRRSTGDLVAAMQALRTQ